MLTMAVCDSIPKWFPSTARHTECVTVSPVIRKEPWYELARLLRSVCRPKAAEFATKDGECPAFSEEVSAMGEKSPKKEVKAPKKGIKEKRREKNEKKTASVGFSATKD